MFAKPYSMYDPQVYSLALPNWSKVFQELVRQALPYKPKHRGYYDIYELLMEPICYFPLPFKDEFLQCSLVQDDNERGLTDAFVLYSYDRHFLADEMGQATVNLNEETSKHLHQMYTAIATYRFKNQPVILGTMTLTVGTLEVDQFFRPTMTNSWGITARELPCEFKRFALHPIFDMESQNRELLYAYKCYLANSLVNYLLQIAYAEQVTHAYIVASPLIYQFMQDFGMYTTRLDAEPVDSPFANAIRQNYSRYWQPNRTPDKQPAPYQMVSMQLDKAVTQQLRRTIGL